MGEVKHKAVIRGSRSATFGYVNDYQNVPEYMFGVSRFSPVGEQTSGLDAEFETAIKVGPKELKSRVKCTEWVDGELIRMQSVSGFGADTLWRFADGDEPGTTKLDAVFTYTLPGGLTGKVLSGLIGPFAEQGVKFTESKIRAAVED